MSLDNDPYFLREEVSNSDLGELEKMLMPPGIERDATAAYRFGSLIDAMITEPWKVDYFKYTCCGVQFTKEEFAIAERMKNAFWKDPFCSMLTKNSQMQRIAVREKFPIVFEDKHFTLPVRIKWDLWAADTLGLTGDIKSTTATTQKQFIAACHHFGYWRQRAWYMDIDGTEKDVLIGISKVNMQVFKIPIIRGGEYYNIGKKQYSELAFQWKYLFGDMEDVMTIELPKLLVAA